MHAKQLRKEAAFHIEFFSQTHYSFQQKKKKQHTVIAKVVQPPGD